MASVCRAEPAARRLAAAFESPWRPDLDSLPGAAAFASGICRDGPERRRVSRERSDSPRGLEPADGAAPWGRQRPPRCRGRAVICWLKLLPHTKVVALNVYPRLDET